MATGEIIGSFTTAVLTNRSSLREVALNFGNKNVILIKRKNGFQHFG